ncbi:MAG: ABC transporter permease [Candidatus Zixiibacteriota bacterium]|nr:MAG: ABC transporter permease [candidate division Zixibacteria bacterium]
MLKNYLLVALRNLKKQKLFSIINVLGMAVGMAGFGIFAISAGVKLNAEKFHKNADRIFGVIQVLPAENKGQSHTLFTPAPLKDALLDEFPEIEKAVRILPAGKMPIRRDGRAFYESDIMFVDSGFLTFFTFDMVSGNPQTALSDPNSIVISESAALKYFGNENPVGRTLIFKKDTELTVTGIFKNLTGTSSIRFHFLIPMEMSRSLSDLSYEWESNLHSTFVMLPDGYDKERLENKFPAFIRKYFTNPDKSPERLYLFPLLDFRLSSGDIESLFHQSNKTGVIIILCIGILLLLVVCINFINLATARFMYRAKEVGLRKVIGARRAQLIAQFLGESLLIAFIALPLAMVLFEFLYPLFLTYMNGFSPSSDMPHVSFSMWGYPFLIKYFLATTILVGFISGIYPAFYLSSFRPLLILKGRFQSGKKRRFGSKAMIIFQFIFSIIFIAFAAILNEQFINFKTSDFGFNRGGVAAVALSEELRSSRHLLQNDFAQNPEITSISASANLPIVWITSSPVSEPDKGPDESIAMAVYGVDYDFIEMLDIGIIRGRTFSREFTDDNSLVISETAASKLQWDDPLGKRLTIEDKTGTVIGVSRDFIFGDIGFEIEPAILFLERENLNYMLLKFSSGTSFTSLRDKLESQWRNIAGDMPFECFTLDDYFQNTLGLLNKLAGFFNLIGFIAIFFSSLGLFGLASYMIERRTKEIGIRKVLGAGLNRVFWVISREFMILVAIANVVGLSIIYIAWNRLLQTGLLFITAIGPGTYLLVISITVIIAMVAVASQTFKAALANPVNALRHE